MNKSKSRSSPTSTQSSDVQNLNLQDIDGVAVAGVDGNVSIATTDQGTVEAARDIAISGIDANLTGFQETVDLAGDVIGAARDQTEFIAGSAVTLAQEGLDFGGRVVGDVLLTSESQTRDVLDFARDSQSGVFELVEDFGVFGSELLDRQQDFIGDAGSQVISAVDRIQARESTNTDARLQDITKIALIVAGGIAVLTVAAQLRK